MVATWGRAVSAVSRLRRKWNWEGNAPRRGNCQHFGPMLVPNQTTGRLRTVWGFCTIGEFKTNRRACCDHWAGRDGSTLITTPDTEAPR